MPGNLNAILFLIVIISFANEDGCPNDCELNGECKNGVCECDIGWKGKTCGILDLDPNPVVAYGYGGLEANTSSWGGGPPAYDAKTKTYHLFVSELAGNCGMGTWQRMSQTIHAVSKNPLGPYRRYDLIIPTESHNTYYVYSPTDKMHLIYTIFSGENPESCNPYFNCTDGTTPGHGGQVNPTTWKPAPSCPLEKATYVHFSPSLHGPWKSAGPLNFDFGECKNCGTSNPAPYIFPNGTVLLLGRGKDVVNHVVQHNIHLYRADSWNSTYVWVPGEGVNQTVNVGDGEIITEDPAIYRNRRGFHVLFHSSPNLSHGWSRDGLSWSWQPTIMGPTVGPGGDNERPRVMVNENGDIAAVFMGQLVKANHDASRTAAFRPNPKKV